jgi:hypothetical protein
VPTKSAYKKYIKIESKIPEKEKSWMQEEEIWKHEIESTNFNKIMRNSPKQTRFSLPPSSFH